MQPLHKLTLREVAAGIGAQRWTAVDVLSASASRIESWEPRGQAFAHLDIEHAAARARALDAAGVLQSIPIAVKDNIDVAGMPTRYGSDIYAATPPAPETAERVEALLRAGAILVGTLR